MKNLNDFNNVYFVGAGGIGMAALERYFMAGGKRVAGYDRTPSPLTRRLIGEGAEIAFEDSVDTIPEPMRNPEDTLVVYTPAVPSTNEIFRYFADGRFEMLKRAAVLGIITRSSKAICFAGTHGKTTTSSMAAHLLEVSGTGSNAFLGGILRNYGSNLLLSPTSAWSVIEADEFDRSFHHLTPSIAVITATDPDHLDIYGTEEAYIESFARFTELIKPDGVLIVHTGLKLVPRTAPGVSVFTYSREEGDFHAENVRIGEGRIVFDFVGPDVRVEDIELGVPVEINIDNAVAA
ncbi:MAG: UDP-N-acetylmuramate--L-alanine ligase, partial [Muribaculaceae bacterium]|nr:UDP-N-acetylmuramate--L-alanine ligase [Muribaculaceae bacterium]